MSIVVNSLVTALTNRRDGFAWGPLNAVSPSFTPDVDEAGDQVRRLMGLDLRGNDWPVLTALTAIESQPVLRRHFPHDGLYDLADYPIPFVTVLNGRLETSDLTGPPAVNRVCVEMPAELDLVVRYDGTTASLAIGKKNYPVTLRKTANDFFQVEWPEESGVTGNLVCDAWAAGTYTDPVVISHFPGWYADDFLAGFVARPEVQNLMALSTFGEFFRAWQMTDLLTAYAALCAELAWRNTAVFPTHAR